MTRINAGNIVSSVKPVKRVSVSTHEVDDSQRLLDFVDPDGILENSAATQ